MNDLQRLLPRHFKVLELAMMGLNTKSIADELGMTPQGVSNITNSPKFQNELALRRDEQNHEIDKTKVTALSKVKTIFESSAEDAANVHVNALTDEDVRVRQTSATAILNRIYGEDKGNSGTGGQVLSAETINVLNISIKEGLSDA
jgi:predicted transcriptional regulator